MLEVSSHRQNGFRNIDELAVLAHRRLPEHFVGIFFAELAGGHEQALGALDNLALVQGGAHCLQFVAHVLQSPRLLLHHAEHVTATDISERALAFTRFNLLLNAEALHLDPDPVAFVARALSGAIWTWAAIRLGGLEFAIGAHLANNLMICLFWQPLSAMEVGRDSDWIELAPELFVAVVMLIVIERLANRPRDRRC